MSDLMVAKLCAFFVFVALVMLSCMSIADHNRLVEVRQMLMDSGHPIEMDR